MMKLHRRLMGDAVIHKCIMADTAMRALMIKAMGDSSMMRDMPGMKGMSAMKHDMASPTGKKPAAASSKGTATKPVVKPATKSAVDTMSSMKGMDHSKMPGMKMPPDTTKKKPPR